MGKVRKRQPKPQKKQQKNVVKDVKGSEAETNCFPTCLLLLFCSVAALGVIAVVGYYRAPFTALPSADISSPVQFVGRFAPNRRLSKGFKVTGLPGPEAFAQDTKGHVYASLYDGRIVKITSLKSGPIQSEDMINVTSGIFPDVPRAMHKRAHGRPLGLRLKENTLFVMDANFGLYMIDLKTHAVSHLLTANATNPPMGFPDDLYITKDGKFIYFTDATAKYRYDTLGYAFMERVCDGRVFQYNTETKETRTVLDELCFANGIQFSADEKLLLVSETMRYRVSIVDVATWRILRAVELPIAPDNIRTTGKGTYWVAGGHPKDAASAFVERNPIVGQILSGLLRPETLLSTTNKKFNMIVEFSDDGEVIQSLHDPDGSLTYGASHVSPLSDGRLILGSYVADHLGILEEKDVALGMQKS